MGGCKKKVYFFPLITKLMQTDGGRGVHPVQGPVLYPLLRAAVVGRLLVPAGRAGNAGYARWGQAAAPESSGAQGIKETENISCPRAGLCARGNIVPWGRGSGGGS